MRARVLLVAAMLITFLPTPAAVRSEASPGAAPAHLTKKHNGWRKTACFDCHDTAAMARTHKSPPARPADCGPCHGYNGAPHEGHAVAINPCGNCHSRVEHAAAFESPGECIKCHSHPKSPKGR